MPAMTARRMTPLSRCFTLRAARLSAAALLLAAGAASEARINWKSGPEQTVTQTRGALLESLTTLTQRGAGRHVVVQLAGPVTDEIRANLEVKGLVLQTYLPEHAFFALVNDGLDAAGLAAEPALLSVQEPQRRWKLDTLLENNVTPSWAVVRIDTTEDGVSDPVFGAYVQFHADVDLKTTAKAVVEGFGGRVVSELAPINGYVIEVPLSRVKEFAEHDGVLWFEAAKPQFDELRNPSNRLRTGAGVVQAAPYNLNGAGVRVMVYDGGTARATHQDFGGRLTNRDAGAVSSHSTHVAGTIGGSGVASAGNNRGMAPGVTLNSYTFQFAGGSGFLYTDPGDLLADYTNAITVQNCVVANNSIGNNTSTNGFPCTWLGDYGTTDQLIDGVVRGQAGAPMRICWAAGNERQSTRCQGTNGGYYTTAPPSNNKNAMVVGALNSNSDTMTTFSSWGPADDGRMKPDFAGPGCQNGADAAGANDNGVTSTTSSSDTAYAVLCGTSMATPTVTGLVALMLQDFRAQNPSTPDPLNATCKALLAHNAQDVLNAGPDYQTGYGSVRIQPTIDFMRLGTPAARNFVQSAATQGSVYTILINIGAGSGPFKATLAWDDFPAAPLVASALVNDLDLRVFDPNGVRRFPWTLNPATPSALAVQTAENHRDNMEQVFVASPVAGTWRIEVFGFNVPQGPQPFSLCFNGTRAACPGDANGDNVVNFQDLNIVLGNFGASVAPGTLGDVNGDGVVNFQDLNIVLGNFGLVC